jgi:8-oxo-dGTP pyrophosphatase MutT (NUDIX family)
MGYARGCIDPGEDVETAMRRELFEETGIEHLKLVALGSHLIRMPHGTVHITSYRAKLSKQTDIILDSEEHHAYAWFSVGGLLDEDNILWVFHQFFEILGYSVILIKTRH